MQPTEFIPTKNDIHTHIAQYILSDGRVSMRCLKSCLYWVYGRQVGKSTLSGWFKKLGVSGRAAFIDFDTALLLGYLALFYRLGGRGDEELYTFLGE